MIKSTLLIIAIFFICSLKLFSQDGTLDSSFGTNGQVITNIGNDYPNALALQKNNDLIVAGDDGNYIYIIRYLPNGRIDSSFGKNGISIIDFNGGYNSYPSIVLNSSGKIIVSGCIIAKNSTSTFLGVTRLTKDGLPDSSFGVNSKTIVKVYDYVNEFFSNITLQYQNKVLITYALANSTNYDFCVRRFSQKGVVDSLFGNKGVQIIDFANKNDKPYKIAVQPDNKIVVGGSTNLATFDDAFALTRLTVDGVLDSLFGNKGKTVIDYGGSSDVLQDLVIDSAANKIIMGGYAHDGPTATDVFALAKTNKDGKLDPSFGVGGKVKTLFPNVNYNHINKILLQPQNKYVAVGVTDSGSAFGYTITMAKYNVKGNLDSSFGNNGKIETLSTKSYHYVPQLINSSAVLQDGKIVVLVNNAYDYMLIRYKSSQKFVGKINDFRNTFSNSISLNDAIKISPNPVTNTLHINGLFLNTDLSIMNLQGQILQTKNVSTSSYDWNIQKLSAGNYFLVASQNNKIVASIKFVKQ